MDYYCEICDEFIKSKGKCNHFRSKTHKDFDKCKHLELTIEKLETNNVDEVIYAYNIQHNKV